MSDQDTPTGDIRNSIKSEPGFTNVSTLTSFAFIESESTPNSLRTLSFTSFCNKALLIDTLSANPVLLAINVSETENVSSAWSQ